MELAAKAKEEPKAKPFADLVKGAKEIKGFFTIYRTDEKTYLELGPDQLDKVVYVALTLESGIGERGFYASQVGGMAPLVFHKEGKTVQLVRKKTRFMAQARSPIERAVTRSFSDSVVGAAAVESLPHPDRKSVLVDLGALLLVPYALDAKEEDEIPVRRTSSRAD